MAVVHTDAFTTGADANLETYDSDWVKYSADAGTIVVLAATDEVCASSDGSPRIYAWEGSGYPTGSQEVQAVVTFFTANTVFSGVAVRVATGAAGADCFVMLLSSTTDDAELYEMEDDNGTLRASWATTLTDATDYTVKLKVVGDGLTGYVDGTQRLLYTDTEPLKASGGPGVYMYTSGQYRVGRLDDWQVDDLNGGTPPSLVSRHHPRGVQRGVLRGIS